MTEEAANRDRPVISVVHQNLHRVTREDIYRSVCPFCYQGNLSMDRDAKKKLLKTGRCNRCGQRVEYLDFNDLAFVKVESRKR
jgi:uncharacterized protein (DUF983 family)